ncbi:MAG: autotransporter-associated beta strand repeat-containing protein, partial [Patescibacteria group bacterium]|nr:autotransporter-associated beta strand repeat-containing protein [Patescibacteria group bacterium]
TGTISGAVGGTGGVTKRDAGAWTLSGSNTYTGATTIAGGVLSVSTLANGGVASSIGQSTNAASNLAFTGGTLRYTGATASTDRRFTIATSGTATFDVVEANTTLTFNNVSGSSFGTGCVIVKDGPGTLAIARMDGGSGYIAEVGAFVINEGRLGTPAGGQINAGRLADSGAAITMGDGTEFSLGTALSSLTAGGNQLVRYVGTTATAILSSHISVTSPNIVFSGPDDTSGSGVFNTKTFDIDDGAAEIDLHLSAHIYTWGGFSGAIPVSNLVKTGAGTLKLSGGDSRYRGETVVRDGRIVVGANAASGTNGALGNATSAIRMGDAETPTGASLALVSDGAFTMGRNVDVHNFGAGTTLGGISNHTSTFAGMVTLNKDVLLTSAATGANATVFTGNITGAGGSVKTGLGVVSLTGEKTYSGSTLVSTGTLALNHAASSNNIASSPLVRVADGATLDVAGLAGSTFQVVGGQTLGGNGTIAGAATIMQNAALAPGMSLGELTFTGRLALEDGAVWDWEFVGSATGEYDRVIGPELLLPTSGTVALNITGLDGYTISAGDSFTLFEGDVYLGAEWAAPGTDLTGLFHITDTIGWWGTWEVTAGSLTLTAVPEPGGWLLLLSLLASGLAVRRRR